MCCTVTTTCIVSEHLHQVACPDLFWPDAQVEVEACLKQQVLHIIWVDSEVEVQRVSQQLVGFLIAFPERNHKVQVKKFNQYINLILATISSLQK